MSAPFRNQIRLLAEEADDILNNQKSFALPVQTGSISQYHTQIRTLINSLDTESQNATEIYNDINRQNDLWMGVRTSMTGAERIADNPIYDEFVQDVPYPTTIRNLKKYINKLRTEKATLSENLPDPSKSTDTLFHLPKLSLPKFSGKCIEFTSFWNSFRVGVHDIPNLSDAVKFNYLKECLDGPALLLIKSLPLTDASYHEAIRLLRENYGNANEINRTLLHSIRKLPIVHSNNGPETFCMELRAFVDQFELLYLQMLEQEFDINTLSVQMELESKLPPLILEEIFKAKDEYGDEWQTDQLRTTLKQILKRKEGIKSLKDQKKELNIPEATRFSPRSPRNNWTNESSPPHTPNSSLTFSTTRNNMPMPRSRFPCVFCNQFSHFSNACTQYPNLQTRTSRLCEKGLCFKCLKNNHQSINCPRPIKCTFCQNNHPRAICRALFNSPQNNTNTLNNSRYNTNNSNRTNPHFPYQTNYSQPQPAQIPSLFANTSSQNFNEFPAHQNHSKYKNEQQLPSPNPEIKPIGPAQINTSSRYVYPRKQNSSPPILLKCIRVEFFNPTYPSKRSTGFLMLDDASTHSYIQKSEAISLGLNMKPTTVNLGVFSNPSCQTTTTFSTEFGLKLIDGRSIYINACTINHLTQPTKYIPPFFETINSTPEFLPSAEIIYPVILLGSDYYYDLEPTPIKKLPSGYTLVSTLLGPIVAGKPYSPSNSIIHNTNFCSQIDDQIQQFLSLEGIGIKEDPGENSEDKVSTRFVKDIKFVDGRYEIKCICPDPLNIKQIELHCFSDASSQAMCAAIYLRIHLSQSIHSTLLFSKTKLKPITKKGQKFTIPKMELIAALIGVRALIYVKSQLPPSYVDENLTLWVDSSVVICWLNSRLPIKEIFIYNRIKPIRATPNLKVRHISGSQNPSDLGTRGIAKPSGLFENNLWLYGPSWLSCAINCWPKENAEIPTFSSNDYKPVLETTETQPIMTFHTTQTKPTPLIEINKFSRLPKLLRVTAYVLRFIAYNGHPSISPFLKKYPRIKNLNISIRELRSALKILIKQEQDYYPPSENEENSLGLFNDENNLIRANGSISLHRANIRSLITSLELELGHVSETITDITSAHEKWMTVRTSMTGAERQADTPIYEAFTTETPFLNILRDLKRYSRKLLSEKAKLTEALPDPSQITNTHFHLPKLSLPKFSGKCVEFTSFWNSFKVGVHDVPDLSDAVKFNYLKECLDGPALLLIKSLPLTNASYHEAIRLLRENYGNADEINRTLLHSIRKLPVVHSNNGPENFCMELRTFVDQFELLYLQMIEQEFDINSLSVQMELESKLPPPLLEEIFKAKDDYGENWQTDQLRTTLKQILKRKEGIKSLKDQKKELNADTVRFSPRSPRNNWTNERSPPHTPNSSLTFFTTRNNLPTPRSRFPCVFCNQISHFSNACTQYPNLQTRTSRLREKGLCFKCFKNNHQSINCPRPIKCTFCQNNHPRAICRALFNSPQNNTNTSNNSRYNNNNSNRTNPQIHYQTNYSQPQPTQIPSLFANTSSQNFNEFPAHQNHSKYKNEQQLPSPNPEIK
uniref:CCHC-type domain-containing protein n=1 Tax=Meloidogyne floridensis TaxID=298350 RepID=A0A915P6W5_9BILA